MASVDAAVAAVAGLATNLFDLLRAERTAIQIGVLGQKYAKFSGSTLKQALADAQWDMSTAQLLRSRSDLFEFATPDPGCTLVRARALQGVAPLPPPTGAVARTGAARQKLGGMDFFRSIGSPQNVVAPMVDQSEQAYRLLCRRYGAQLCYTPMFHSRLFAESARYRQEAWLQPPPGASADRPLFVQFCGNDPQTLLRAGRMVQDHCDAVDLNLGCPQGIARRGRYGAFLLTETELLREIVSTLHANLDVPVTCKIRLLPRFEDTLKLVETLVDAGCQLLTVHGRTKEMNKQAVRETDWDAIRRIREFVDGRIPVFANGSIACLEDAQRCMAETGVNGVMTSEAILEHPALFAGGRRVSGCGRKQGEGEGEGEGECDDGVESDGAHGFVTQDQLAREYLDLCRSHPPTSLKTVRSHLYKFLYTPMQHFPEQRAALGQAESMEDFEAVVNFFAQRRQAESEAAEQGAPAAEAQAASNASDAEHSGTIKWALEGQCGVHSWYGRHRAAEAKATRRAEEDAAAAAEAGGANADSSAFAAIDDGSIGNLLATADY